MGQRTVILLIRLATTRTVQRSFFPSLFRSIGHVFFCPSHVVMHVLQNVWPSLQDIGLRSTLVQIPQISSSSTSVRKSAGSMLRGAGGGRHVRGRGTNRREDGGRAEHERAKRHDEKYAGGRGRDGDGKA